jgi:hypothetical protein
LKRLTEYTCQSEGEEEEEGGGREGGADLEVEGELRSRGSEGELVSSVVDEEAATSCVSEGCDRKNDLAPSLPQPLAIGRLEHDLGMDGEGAMAEEEEEAYRRDEPKWVAGGGCGREGEGKGGNSQERQHRLRGS